MMRHFAVALFMVTLWGCEYTAYEDLQCALTSECPEGATCRSGYCAWDVIPTEDMPEDDGDDTTVHRVEVTPNLALSVNDTAQMQAVAHNAAGDILSGLTFTWTSSNPNVATVDGGTVTAIASGMSTIEASASGVTGSARVDVNNPAVSIEITPATQEIGVNTEYTFTASPKDANGDSLPGAIQWESTDPSVLTVDATGRARGVSEGTAKLIATFQTVNAEADVTVVVLEPNVIEIDPPQIRVPQGKQSVLTAKAFYREGNFNVEVFDVPVEFTLNVATYGVIASSTEDGRQIAIFTAHESTAGTAILTATAGSLVTTAEIETYRPIVGTITITPETQSRFVGEEIAFRAEVRGTLNEEISRDITWSVDLPTIANIDATTGLLRTLAPGVVEVTATVDTFTATTSVTVAGFGASSVSAGADHTCAITSANYAYCWGKGLNGRLGAGNANNAPLPQLVSGTQKFETIEAANEHTCALSAGVGDCWGKGDKGRLGRGNNSDSSSPVEVSGGLEFTQLSTMTNHTCAVSKQDEIFCWGQGNDGRLGNNGTGDESSPKKIEPPLDVVAPVWAMVAAGAKHTCALTSTFEAYCWGANTNGEIGDGTTDSRLVPTAVDVSGLNGAVFNWIGAGKDFSCGRTLAGALYCWGSNENGRLGMGSSDASRPTPILVDGNHIFITTDLGRDHVCGATAANVYCWGLSTNGRLGDTDMDQNQPFVLLNTPAYLQITAGGGHTCGIGSDSKPKCFGKNAEGQIGDGTIIDQQTPSEVWP